MIKLCAFIPAKSHSNRLPNKNYRFFFGRPIVEWVKEEVRKTEIFTDIFISTDKDRPIDLLKEGITIKDILLYHIGKEIDIDNHYICVIQPCAYAVTAEHLIRSFLKMFNNKMEFCYSYGMINTTAVNYDMDNGGFYWVKTEAFLKYKDYIHKNAWRYEMPQVDINTFQDFTEAKLDVYNNHRERFLCGI